MKMNEPIVFRSENTADPEVWHPRNKLTAVLCIAKSPITSIAIVLAIASFFNSPS